MDALNYTPKAIEFLNSFGNDAAPLSTLGFRYIRDKLRAAQVFVLPDHGELFDRTKPRPELPSDILRPPFPVAAVEFTARGARPGTPLYAETKCSRRIALAFDWQNDLPAPLVEWCPPNLAPGVVIASLAYYDDLRAWMPISAMVHIAYDAPWLDASASQSPFRDAVIASGRASKAQATAGSIPMQIVPILPEILTNITAVAGIYEARNVLLSDLMDETNAYSDLCYALACRNVRIQHHPASAKLNHARGKAGKELYPDHHTLMLSDAPVGSGNAFTGAAGNGPRSHLRRGHIRRLGPDRVTWVNQTMVQGRGGFVDKTYAMAASA